MSGARGEPLGAVYAEALAEAAEAKGALAAVGEELAGIAALWRRDPDVRAFLLSGGIPREAKAKAMDRIFRGRVHDLTADFLQVLLRRGRLVVLPAAAEAFVTLLDRRLGRVPVTLQTAVEVAPADLEAWRARLRAALGREPVLSHQVRPALVGGAVLRVGDVVADGSLRRRLADLRDRALRASSAATTRS